MKINLSSISALAKLFVIAILFVSWTILFFDKCEKKKTHIVIPEVSQTQKILDSIKIVTDIKELKHKQDSISLSKEKDSLQIKLDTTKKLLIASQDKLHYYNNQLKIADLKLDTSLFYNYCDSLSHEAMLMTGTIKYYIGKNDTLKLINDSLLITAQQRIEERSYVINTLRSAQSNFAFKYDSLASAYNKAIDKNNRQYSIGLGAAFGITNIGTPGCVVGIVVSRNIARFSLPKNKN